MFLSFVILVFNSVVLYIAPEGRVAYWADWRFWGLTKSQWGDQHVTIGVLFLIAGVLHLYYNWNPILAYMKNKAREVKIFTGPFNIALAISIAFVIGTFYSLPPMNIILNISDSFKQAGSRKYGEPPYGHAELSTLKMFAKKENLDLEQALVLLKAAGFSEVDEKETIKDIAGMHNLTPQQVYEIIKAAKRKPDLSKDGKKAQGFPDAPAPGFGRKTLEAFCIEYNLDLKQVITGLAKQGIKVNGGNTIKEIAGANNKEPIELFEIMQAMSNKKEQSEH